MSPFFPLCDGLHLNFTKVPLIQNYSLGSCLVLAGVNLILEVLIEAITRYYKAIICDKVS